MAEDFDPYFKWLGIPPKHQPPHHYRLLALELFESDGDVIENAADQRTSHLRNFATGAHSTESQKLLNEVANARLTLLSPDKKAAYDAKLRQELRPQGGPQPQRPAASPRVAAGPGRTQRRGASMQRPVQPRHTQHPAAQPQHEAVIVTPAVSTASRVKQQRQQSQKVLMLSAGAVLVVIAAAAFAFYPRGEDPAEIAQNGPNGTSVETVEDGTESATDSVRTGTESSAPKEPAEVMPPSESSAAESDPAAPGQEAPAGPEEKTAEVSRPPVEDTSETVVVEPMVEPTPEPLVVGDELSKPAVPDPAVLQPGLQRVTFDKLAKQQGHNCNAHPTEFGPPVELLDPVSEVQRWRFPAEMNGVAFGYLKIDEPGLYYFHAYNFYDRCAIYVNQRLICPYRGTVGGGTTERGLEKIELEAGLVPFVCVGYWGSRGSVEVSWKLPSAEARTAIPAENLFYDPSVVDPRGWVGKVGDPKPGDPMPK